MSESLVGGKGRRAREMGEQQGMAGGGGGRWVRCGGG